jgi:hypothetical protein
VVVRVARVMLLLLTLSEGSLCQKCVRNNNLTTNTTITIIAKATASVYLTMKISIFILKTLVADQPTISPSESFGVTEARIFQYERSTLGRVEQGFV